MFLIAFFLLCEMFELELRMVQNLVLELLFLKNRSSVFDFQKSTPLLFFSQPFNLHLPMPSLRSITVQRE